MHDEIASASVPGKGIALAAAVTTDLVQVVRDIHDLSPTVTAALGRLMTGAALLATGLKDRQRLSLVIEGDGPVERLAAEAWVTDDAAVGVRGYARWPRAELPANERGKFDVAALVGKGRLQVATIHDLGRPYVGVIELRTGEIAEDLAAYLADSVQIPSLVALGVLATPRGVGAAGGLIAQALPGAEERAVETLEAHARELRAVTSLIDAGHDAVGLLNELAGTLPLGPVRRRPVRFACRCSREKVESVLASMGAAELRSMARERDRTVATCEYCSTAYLFSREALLELADRVEGREPAGGVT
jgi:molecular chaperone Hsp33